MSGLGWGVEGVWGWWMGMRRGVGVGGYCADGVGEGREGGRDGTGGGGWGRGATEGGREKGRGEVGRGEVLSEGEVVFYIH
jgi:hypothetical protein